MKIPVRRVGQGLHPEEVVVAIDTKDGEENLAVHSASLTSDAISVGWPVGQKDGFYLVELPRETFRGFWRVWVEKKAVFQDLNEARMSA